jgi:RNA polymerase sigma-70 factor (ECF subfamily)
MGGAPDSGFCGHLPAGIRTEEIRFRPIRRRPGNGFQPYEARLPEDPVVKEAVHIGKNPSAEPDLQDLMGSVALGDQQAFAGLYDVVAGPVIGVVRGVLRDQAQSEEVAQEVLVEVWRSAARYRSERGSVINWVLTLAHQRAVDRVRSVEASAAREHRAALLDHAPEYDEVTEQVEARLEREQVRRCLRTLTELQRQSVTLAYYRGMTYREVAESLALPLGTVKTRLRDGLIRLRDCLGVTA